jgi:hypothetical protein
LRWPSTTAALPWPAPSPTSASGKPTCPEPWQAGPPGAGQPQATAPAGDDLLRPGPLGARCRAAAVAAPGRTGATAGAGRQPCSSQCRRRPHRAHRRLAAAVRHRTRRQRHPPGPRQAQGHLRLRIDGLLHAVYAFPAAVRWPWSAA